MSSYLWCVCELLGPAGCQALLRLSLSSLLSNSNCKFCLTRSQILLLRLIDSFRLEHYILASLETFDSPSPDEERICARYFWYLTVYSAYLGTASLLLEDSSPYPYDSLASFTCYSFGFRLRSSIFWCPPLNWISLSFSIWYRRIGEKLTYITCPVELISAYPNWEYRIENISIPKSQRVS